MSSVETLKLGPERSFLSSITDNPSRFDKNRWQQMLDTSENGRRLDNWKTADEVAGMVRKVFKWGDIDDRHVSDLEPARIDSLANRMSCHGYTIVASECLEWLDIDHDIGLVGNHSLILVNSSDGNGIHMISFPNDWMDGDVSNCLTKTADGKAVFDTRRLLSQKDHTSYLSRIKELPWVTNGSAEGANRFMVDVDIYPSERGREIIRHGFNARWHSVRGNYGKAALSLAWLNAVRPEDDSQFQQVA